MVVRRLDSDNGDPRPDKAHTTAMSRQRAVGRGATGGIGRTAPLGALSLSSTAAPTISSGAQPAQRSAGPAIGRLLRVPVAGRNVIAAGDADVRAAQREEVSPRDSSEAPAVRGDREHSVVNGIAGMAASLWRQAQAKTPSESAAVEVRFPDTSTSGTDINLNPHIGAEADLAAIWGADPAKPYSVKSGQPVPVSTVAATGTPMPGRRSLRPRR